MIIVIRFSSCRNAAGYLVFFHRGYAYGVYLYFYIIKVTIRVSNIVTIIIFDYVFIFKYVNL